MGGILGQTNIWCIF